MVNSRQLSNHNFGPVFLFAALGLCYLYVEGINGKDRHKTTIKASDLLQDRRLSDLDGAYIPHSCSDGRQLITCGGNYDTHNQFQCFR